MDLMAEIEEILDDGGFSYCEYRGCFDVAARRDSMLLIKVLPNIDSFQEEQANNLKIISGSLGARSLLVGLHTRRDILSDSTLYDRFDVPAMNTRTFGSMIRDRILPMIYRFRGGLFAEIDPGKLRVVRETSGLSQSELAARVGITKKSVYEHENRRMKMNYASAMKMERTLKADLISPLGIDVKYGNVDSAPKTAFETKVSGRFRKIGFGTSSVYQSPFNMIAKDSDLLFLSDVEEKPSDGKIRHMKEFSGIARKSAMIVTKEEANFDIPSLTEENLSELDSRAIRRMLKNW